VRTALRQYLERLLFGVGVVPFEVGVLAAKFLIEVGHIVVHEQFGARRFHGERACVELEADGLHRVPLLAYLVGSVLDGGGKLDNRVVVEGHTDAQPYRYGGFYTNWELSTDRANAARRVLESAGLWKGQVAEVRGYADTRLRNPMDPFHYSNRRVSLLIPYMSEPDTKAPAP
jgi:Flagellar motor protein